MNKLFIGGLLFFLTTLAIYPQTTYYLSLSGNDSNSGKSSSSPWKTINKVNSTRFAAGDKILFKSGDSFTGQWTITNSGSSNGPIYIGSYGSGANPIIDGSNTLQYLVLMKDNVNFITFENLDFRNCNPQYSGGSKALVYLSENNSNIVFKSCNFSQGKLSSNSNFAMLRGFDANNITVQDCDITGKSQGIYFIANSSSSHKDVHHISVIDNYFHDIDARPSWPRKLWSVRQGNSNAL